MYTDFVAIITLVHFVFCVRLSADFANLKS